MSASVSGGVAAPALWGTFLGADSRPGQARLGLREDPALPAGLLRIVSQAPGGCFQGHPRVLGQFPALVREDKEVHVGCMVPECMGTTYHWVRPLVQWWHTAGVP